MTPEPTTAVRSPDPVTEVVADVGSEPDSDKPSDARIPAVDETAPSSASASEFGDPGGIFLG